MILVRGGAMGVPFKSNVPMICAYANNLGFVLDVIGNSIVSLSNTTKKRIFLSTDANTDKK